MEGMFSLPSVIVGILSAAVLAAYRAVFATALASVPLHGVELKNG